MWCWPHEFGQPLILMSVFAASPVAPRPSASSLAVIAAAAARDEVTARLHVSAPWQLVTSRTVWRSSRARLVDPGEQDVLIDGESHGAVADLVGDLAERAHLLAGDVPEVQADVRRDVCFMSLIDDRRGPPREVRAVTRDGDVVDDRAGRRTIGGRRQRELGSGLGIDLRADPGVFVAEALLAHLLPHVLQACALAVLAISKPMEDAEDGLADPPDLTRAHEIAQNEGVLR
jgi:hypothetical protein